MSHVGAKHSFHNNKLIQGESRTVILTMTHPGCMTLKESDIIIPLK